MPEYTYLDERGHETTVYHRMLYSTGVMCHVCGSAMWRKPSVPNINWNGLRPSQGDLHPEIQQLIDTKDERRYAFEQEHEQHEQQHDG